MEDNTSIPDIKRLSSSTNIEDHFPFDEIRPQQKRALEAITNGERKNLKHWILELPTGAGKSGIAYAIASWAATFKEAPYQAGAHILTSQRILMYQYVSDFASKGMVELKGANNYHCNKHELDCSAGGKLNKASKKARQKEAEESKEEYGVYPEPLDDSSCEFVCPYKEAKQAYLYNKIGVTNFAYFLNEVRYGKRLPPRTALIVDEAHNTEKEVLGFADIELNKARCSQLDVEMPPIFNPGDEEKVLDWINKDLMPKGVALEAKLLFEMQEACIQDAPQDVILALSRKHDSLDKFLCRVRRFNNSDGRLKDWFTYTDETTGSLFIKPMTATLFTEDLLLRMGKRHIFMSATILDKVSFARNLGLDASKTGFLRLESDFPVENRSIHFLPTGKMSFKHIDENIPRVVKRIIKILDKHHNEKGIIHCHSYKLQKALIDALEDSRHKSRILAPSNLPGERDRAIAKHVISKEATVLLSPSMTEGLDLKDDLSRWQVIAKTPYMSLGDRYVRARMERDPAWYTLQTALTLVQATGRSIRSSKDYCTTYLLDSDFGGFLARASSILPRWWLDSIVYHN